VRKLTMPQTQKNGAKLTTSRFCVLLWVACSVW
jgi:hypothetical protein